MRSSIEDLPPSIARFEDVSRTRSPSDQLGRQDFLLLLTTQLQNQNPLEPVQNEAFVAQLAQFSQLEATLTMSESIRKMVESTAAERVLNGASLVGRQVAAPGGQASLVAGRPLSGSVSLPTGAESLTINIYSAEGELVRSLLLGRQSPGEASFSWDGFREDGNPAAAGGYRVEAIAGEGGQNARLPVVTTALVTAVRIDAARESMMLELEGGRLVSLADVQRITN